MIPALFDTSFLDEYGFKDTRLYKEIAAHPILLIDVGARWGPPQIFELFPELFSVIAFEADPVEAARLSSNDRGWANFRVHNCALGNRASQGVIHVTDRPNNSSAFEPDQGLVSHYGLEGFAVEKQFPIQFQPLDVFAYQADVIKIDVQGGELDVITGGAQVMERVQCAIVEADFWPIYKNAPLFSEVEIELRKSKLSFYGFKDEHHCRGRMTHADAIFFRDGTWNDRNYMVQGLMSLILGYFDHFAEMVGMLKWGDDEKAALLAFVKLVREV